MTMETLVDQISRSTPPSMVNATLQNIFDQSVRNGSQLKAMLQGVATILMNRPIPVNNLLEFYSQKQPKLSLFILSDTDQRLFCNLQASCYFKFQPGHLFAPEELC